MSRGRTYTERFLRPPIGEPSLPAMEVPLRNVPVAVEIGKAGVDRLRPLGLRLRIANRERGDRRHDEAYRIEEVQPRDGADEGHAGIAARDLRSSTAASTDCVLRLGLRPLRRCLRLMRNSFVASAT